MARTAPDLVREGIGMLLTLKRAGVPVLWSARVTELRGDERVRSALVAGRAFDRSYDVDVVALNLGFQPETGLARALGAKQRFVDVGLGHLASETDEDGRTSVAGVFAVGDGASLGGARVAMARGRLAGLAAARELGLHAPDEPATRAALRRALAFQDALWTLFRPIRLRPGTLPDETIVCRCEEVTAGRLRQELAGGLTSLPALKKATRAGMGRCQGRFCAATIARLCPDAPDDYAFAAPRAPLRPVPAAPLMFQAPEFEAPLLELPAPPLHLHSLPSLPPGDAALRRAGDRRRAGRPVQRVFPRARRRRCAAGRTRRGGHGGEHRECRQPARATAVLRLHRRDAGRWRPGRAYAAARAALDRAVEGDRGRAPAKTSASAPRAG